ncbi:MAG: NAD(P)H-hydrate dehydratase, partial [Gammaproteobacteria bacterium]|nr:NAD(P)H-hydrate dehydratase [Gammaproteobacteria bacterium]
GLYLGRGPDRRGRIELSNLDLPRAVYADTKPVLRVIAPAASRALLEPRSAMSHKGLNGKVLVVGGGPAMAGAVRLAAEAALRAGAGLVYAAVHPASVIPVTAGRPEIICRGVESVAEFADWLEAADVIVLGPGLGRSPWSHELASAVLGTERPLVVDADGLNYVAENPVKRGDWVVTPHPAEAGRLLQRSTAAVQADRAAAVNELADRTGAIAVLKGACSLVAQTSDAKDSIPAVCDAGNPGMATAGMGDVLAGCIGGLIAQFGLSAATVETAVAVHALAGDDAAAAGERGLIASDLLPFIRRRVNRA